MLVVVQQPEIAPSVTLAGMNKTGLLLLAVLPLPPLAFSQTAIAAKAPEAASVAPPQVITLRNSVVALTGPWRFQPGDSPWAKGTPVWAQPDFDDSRWAVMSMAQKSGSVDLVRGTAGFVPGWTRRGYPDLSGYAWYRLRVRVTDPGEPLWLKMPEDFDDAYQVYANGRYVGQFGQFSTDHVNLYASLPASFPLASPGPEGEIELAVRFYMSPSTRFTDPDVGGMHQPPALGLASTVHLLQATENDANLHSWFGDILRALFFLLAAPLALWAWLQNNRDRTYLWLFLALASSIVRIFVGALAGLSTALTIDAGNLLLVVLLNPLVLPWWVMFWWNWFELREARWIPLAAWLLAAAQMLATFCAQSPHFGLTLMPQAWLHWFNSASVLFLAAVGLLLLIILVEGFRRDRTEALTAMLPILLLELASFGLYLLAAFNIPYEFFPFGIGISISSVSSTLMVLVICALALRRFVRTQVREQLARQVIDQDLEQAKQLQQRVLVPETIASKVFTVESEYRPAQTVGGDFFQTLSRPDGTLLVVIGDVSGKGVSAAMLVAVLVGAIRNQAEHSFDPPAMLETLNRRLIGRSGGHFATCLAAEISPDGQMGIANAGHIPPYLNGKELDLEGSLPLGVADGAEYSVQTIILKPADRLTFMTDGVVEATNPAKELFGFDRTRAISNQHAAAIVEQAQTFGQEDDITVLGVEFAVA
ncbi:MAG: PP2C family protein-serine/threonine phosphatase [Terracidiphilus sp.]